jgi:DNA-binding response OmpR family regulator
MIGENENLLSAKILIVDDDRRVLAAISTRLEEVGYQCISCYNAYEAVATFFTAGGVDLVITDLTMPGMDGLSIVGLVRSYGEVPIIVITGDIDAYWRLVTRYNRISVLRKPFEPHALISCVRSVLADSSVHEGRSA